MQDLAGGVTKGCWRCSSSGVLKCLLEASYLWFSVASSAALNGLYCLIAFLMSVLDCKTKITTVHSFISPFLPVTVFCNIQEHLVYQVVLHVKISSRTHQTLCMAACFAHRIWRVVLWTAMHKTNVGTFLHMAANMLLCLGHASRIRQSRNVNLNIFIEAHEIYLLDPQIQRLWSAVCLLVGDIATSYL